MSAPRSKTVTPGHGWMYYTRGAAKIAMVIAAFRFIEVLIAPPTADEPRWVVAGVLTFKYWAAGLALGGLTLLGWVSQRLVGWPAPEAPSAAMATRNVVQTAEMRLRGLGFNLVCGWLLLSFLALLMMADTGTGPFARLAMDMFGPNEWSGLETFVLGLPLIAAPLVLLALLPWQTRFPLVSSMQAIVKPPAKAHTRRRKRP